MGRGSNHLIEQTTPGNASRPLAAPPCYALVVALLCAAITCGPLAGDATAQNFLGSSVVVNGHYPNLATPPNMTQGPTPVVNPGMEFPLLYNSFSSDIGVTQITLNSITSGNNLGCGFGPTAFNGFSFTFTGLALPILSVSLDAGTTLVPFAISSNANQVFVDYQCLGTILNNVSTIINVTFENATPTKRTTWGRVRQLYR